jgi:CHAD domain-containing protein
MTDDDNLKLYLRKKINTVIRELSTSADERTPETFHRLRVEIKKIRALFSLIAYVDGGFKKHSKKYFEQFKPPFKKAGKVRQLQMEEEMLCRYRPDVKLKSKTPVAQWLMINQKKQEKAIAVFEKETGNKTNKRIDKTGEKIEAHLDRITQRSLIEYNKYAEAELRKRIQNAFTKKETHDVRKQIKELLYNLKLTVSADDRVIKQTDHLQDTIGKWHDGEATVIYLDKIIDETRHENKQDIVRLMKAAKRISDDNKKLFQQINESRKKLKNILDETEQRQGDAKFKR